MTNKSSQMRLLPLSVFFQFFALCLLLVSSSACAQRTENVSVQDGEIVLGIEQMEKYTPLLKGKKVGLVANHSSKIGSMHLLDTLLSIGLDVQKVFSPEHGFRGDADAGEKVDNQTDPKSGIGIVSLYGSNKKPSQEQLSGLDILVFDMQDVGVRFYTYISTLHYVMEAAAEKEIPVLLLDRPNPNGHYVDGPVLQKGFESFVGMHTIPIVHGMTLGEYAQMINGEGWLSGSLTCELIVVKCINYSHEKTFDVKIPPSPNLPNMNSIYWYPSICLFEGTSISVGRGTQLPFQMIGHPSLEKYKKTFSPRSMKGAKRPKLMGKACFGIELEKFNASRPTELDLTFLKKFYDEYPVKTKYFNAFFNKLAGNDVLKKQIIQGMPIEDIRESWQKELNLFKETRRKYLLYD